MISSAIHEIIRSQVLSLIILGLVVVITSAFARAKGYYTMPNALAKKDNPIRFIHLFLGFAIYFVIILISPFLLSKLLFKLSLFHSYTGDKKSILLSSCLTAGSMSLVILFLSLFVLLLPSNTRNYLLKYKTEKSSSIYFDFFIGIISWIIVFPIVLFSSQILELLTQLLLQVQHFPEQVAIYYLKQTLNHPLAFIAAIVFIIIFAPLIEEFLFRSLLQSWLKSKMDRKAAILIASLCFAFFHFSPSQGSSNITIIGSLFILGIFLGFLYERQRSLIAPIALHATFNCISIINLIYVKGI
jgi:uncharacterized protein